MQQTLSAEEKKNLIALADQTLSALNPELRYVLVACWNKALNAYTPHLTSPEGFDRDADAILLQFNYKPKYRMISYPSGVGDQEDELDENLVSGSVDPKTGRVRIIIDCEKRNKPIRAAPFKKWLDHKNIKPYFFPEDLDTIDGWSNEKEVQMIQALKLDGLYKDEAEPLKPKLSEFKEGQKPEIKKYWIDILNSIRDEMHLKYPQSEIDEELDHALDLQFEFENLYGINPLNEMLRTNPVDIKHSFIQDLYFSGALKDFPFKFKVTAFLLAKGFRNAQDAVFIFRHQCLGLKKFFPEIASWFCGIYTESDFYTYQSIIESLLAKIMKNSFSDRNDLKKLNAKNDSNFFKNTWERVKLVQNSFTQKQSELVELLYLNRPQLTYEETALVLGISFDSVRDREEGVILKIKTEFFEFKGLSPYKGYHKNNLRIWSYMGCRHNPTAEKIHPCYRIKIQNGIEVKEFITHGNLIAEKLNRVLGLNGKIDSNYIDEKSSKEIESGDLLHKDEPSFTILESSP